MPGYSQIETRDFYCDADMLRVSTFYHPDKDKSQRVLFEVRYYPNYKGKDSYNLCMYIGFNWMRAYDEVHNWFERRYKKKINDVLAEIDCMCCFSDNIDKGASK